MTDEQLNEIEKRAEAGVQWTPEECEIKTYPDGYNYIEECATLGDTMIQLVGHYENYQDDWLFCAHARSDMKALITEIKRLKNA